MSICKRAKVLKASILPKRTWKQKKQITRKNLIKIWFVFFDFK